jgi:hypothetical protein
MGLRNKQRQDEQESSANVLEVDSKRKSVPVNAGDVAGFEQTGQLIFIGGCALLLRLRAIALALRPRLLPQPLTIKRI